MVKTSIAIYLICWVTQIKLNNLQIHDVGQKHSWLEYKRSAQVLCAKDPTSDNSKDSQIEEPHINKPKTIGIEVPR